MKKSLISCIPISIYTYKFQTIIEEIRVTEQLNNLIYDDISTLRRYKKQPNEKELHSLISSNLESLSKEELGEPLNCLVNELKLKNKPHNGKNYYYIEKE